MPCAVSLSLLAGDESCVLVRTGTKTMCERKGNGAFCWFSPPLGCTEFWIERQDVPRFLAINFGNSFQP